MRIGNPFRGIQTQGPKNYGRAENELPFVQDALDATVNRANRQYIEAFKVDGVRYLHWGRAMEGYVCTCKAVKPEQADGTGVNSSGLSNSDDPSYSPSISDPWDALTVRGVKSSRHSRDDGIYVNEDDSYSSGKVRDAEVDEAAYTIDFNDEDFGPVDLSDNTYTQNILDLLGKPLSSGEIQCGICLDTGYVNGYRLTGGDRIIFDASGQVPVYSVAGFSIDKLKSPNVFTLSSAMSGAYVQWLWEVPTHFKKALSVSVRNNQNPAKNVRLEYKPFQETQDLWKELTVEVLNSFKGLPTKLILRVYATANDLSAAVTFTHVEITLQYKDWNKMQMPPLSENGNLAIFETPTSMSVILPPSHQNIKPLDYILDLKYDRLWRVLDVTDAKTAKQQILGWQVNLRLILKHETAHVLRVAYDPEFGLSFATMQPHQEKTFTKNDIMTYVDKLVGIQEKARLLIRSLVLNPQTGEFSIGTSKVKRNNIFDNVNEDGLTYLEAAVYHFKRNYPNLTWIWLEPSWFGTDLRAGSCQILPKVKNTVDTTAPYSWVVNNLSRSDVSAVSSFNSKPAYDGTFSDKSFVEAINYLKANGYKVGIKPKILMDITDAQALPAIGGGVQPRYPNANNINYDGDINKVVNVNTFFGTHVISDFTADELELTTISNKVGFTYSRFIIHYILLSDIAGGVDAFIIGSDLRNLTINVPEAITHLLTLAQAAKETLNCLVSYEASSFEYGGQISGQALSFPLDALWSNVNIDFVAIKFDLEWTDWATEGSTDQLTYTSLYDPTYLNATLKGGIHYDYYYSSELNRTNGIRTPISGDWRKRKKAFSSWVSNSHITIDGSGIDSVATSWVAMSKPIVFTTFSIPAIDRGTNGPYSSSMLRAVDTKPYFTDSSIDNMITKVGVYTFLLYWLDKTNNLMNTYNVPAVRFSMNCAGYFNILNGSKLPTEFTISNRELINNQI